MNLNEIETQTEDALPPAVQEAIDQLYTNPLAAYATVHVAGGTYVVVDNYAHMDLIYIPREVFPVVRRVILQEETDGEN